MLLSAMFWQCCQHLSGPEGILHQFGNVNPSNLMIVNNSATARNDTVFAIDTEKFFRIDGNVA
jgi:hypothetical protein